MQLQNLSPPSVINEGVWTSSCKVLGRREEFDSAQNTREIKGNTLRLTTTEFKDKNCMRPVKDTVFAGPFEIVGEAREGFGTVLRLQIDTVEMHHSGIDRHIWAMRLGHLQSENYGKILCSRVRRVEGQITTVDSEPIAPEHPDADCRYFLEPRGGEHRGAEPPRREPGRRQF
jgi:hypothetical protein